MWIQTLNLRNITGRFGRLHVAKNPPTHIHKLREALEKRRVHLRIFSKVKKQISDEQSYYISFIKIQSIAKLRYQLWLCSI